MQALIFTPNTWTEIGWQWWYELVSYNAIYFNLSTFATIWFNVFNSFSDTYLVWIIGINSYDKDLNISLYGIHFCSMILFDFNNATLIWVSFGNGFLVYHYCHCEFRGGQCHLVLYLNCIDLVCITRKIVNSIILPSFVGCLHMIYGLLVWFLEVRFEMWLRFCCHLKVIEFLDDILEDWIFDDKGYGISCNDLLGNGLLSGEFEVVPFLSLFG